MEKRAEEEKLSNTKILQTHMGASVFYGVDI